MSIDELIALAEQGIAQAQNDLGMSYITGEGVDPNISKAIEWLSKAAEQNEPSALANLGKCYMEGMGVEKNVTKAIDLFAKSCRQGVVSAKHYLVDTIDINDLILLAEKGNAQAQYFLGTCYADGEKLNRNISKALEWFLKSAEQDEPLALVILGFCFSEGIWVKKSLLTAEDCFARAAESGFVGALRQLDSVREKITKEIPYYLVKVTDKKWADKLLDGKVFMRSISCFADLLSGDSTTNNTFRGDSMEGFYQSFGDGHNPYAYIETNDGIEEIIPGQLGVIDVLMLREKIFCLYAFDYDESGKHFVKPDSRLLDFGDTAVLILDTKEFLHRVCNAVQARFGSSFWMSFKRVAYDIDLSENSVYSEFSKSKSYSWQREFRIALDLTEGRFDKRTLDSITDFAKLTFPGRLEEDIKPDSVADSLTLNIGSIRDISIAIPTNQFVECENIETAIDGKFFPPSQIPPLEIPREPRPTFFKPLAQLPL